MLEGRSFNPGLRPASGACPRCAAGRAAKCLEAMHLSTHRRNDGSVPRAICRHPKADRGRRAAGNRRICHSTPLGAGAHSQPDAGSGPPQHLDREVRSMPRSQGLSRAGARGAEGAPPDRAGAAFFQVRVCTLARVQQAELRSAHLIASRALPDRLVLAGPAVDIGETAL